MIRYLCSLTLIVGIYTPCSASFIYSGSSAQYGDTTSSLGYNGPTPTNINRTGTFNGMNYDIAYSSSLAFNPQLSMAIQDYQVTLGGPTNGISQLFHAQAITAVGAQLDYSGFQSPGYDGILYASMFGVLKIHLAPGDSLTYRVSGTVNTNGPINPFLFDNTFGADLTTAGDYTIDISVPITPIARLSELRQRGQVNITTTHAIFLTVVRGVDGTENTVVNFDPGTVIESVPNSVSAVPGPPSILLALTGLVPLGLARRLRSRAK